MKIRPIGAELFHANRQTDMMKLIVAFRNITKAPENSQLMSYGKVIVVYSENQTKH